MYITIYNNNNNNNNVISLSLSMVNSHVKVVSFGRNVFFYQIKIIKKKKEMRV